MWIIHGVGDGEGAQKGNSWMKKRVWEQGLGRGRGVMYTGLNIPWVHGAILGVHPLPPHASPD